MNILESLENLNVSEECFDEIMGIVEEIINELDKSTLKSYIEKRDTEAKEAERALQQAKKEGTATRSMLDNYLKKVSKAQYAKEKGGQAIRYSAEARHRSKKNLEDSK